MENPVDDIPGVLKALCQGSPEEQQQAIRTYFLPDAAFTHPFCRVPSMGTVPLPGLGNLSSRHAIEAIYRWYRVLSPNIDFDIDSRAFDKRNGILYITVRQRFTIWFIPLYSANVRLLVELHLVHQRAPVGTAGVHGSGLNATNRPRYYIASQEDHYQVNEFLRFALPVAGPLLWAVWQLISTFICILLVLPAMAHRRYVHPLLEMGMAKVNKE